MLRYSIQEIRDYLRTLYWPTLAPDQPVPPLLLTPYAYTLTFAVAQNASQTLIQTITSNADFLLLGLRHRANIAAAQNVSTKTAPFARVMIIDSGSNEQFTQAATDFENISENGNVARNLPFPRLIRGKSSLSVTVSNYAPVVETYGLDICFEGINVRLYN